MRSSISKEKGINLGLGTKCCDKNKSKWMMDRYSEGLYVTYTMLLGSDDKCVYVYHSTISLLRPLRQKKTPF